MSARLAALTAFTAASLGLVVVACGGSEAAAPESPVVAGSSGTSGGNVSTVTFHRDVEPILQKSCQSCHVAGGIAPFPLVSYADAKPQAASIVDMTQQRIMPPWGAHDTADCKPTRPWKDDLRLSEAELATLDAWSKAGAPEGDPKDAPPPLAKVGRDLAGAQLALKSETGYAMSASSDQLRCFVLDPKLAKEVYVNAMQVVPERPEVVHHVLVFADPKGESRALADANGQYECFGGTKVSGATLMTAWAPGSVANELPADVGMPLEAGSLVVMQVHYHSAPGASAPADRTTVQLRYTETAPKRLAYTQLVGNFRGTLPAGLGGLEIGPNDGAEPRFEIPPNVKDHTETMKLVMPPTLRGKPVSTFKLLSTGGHMHYVGVKEEVKLTRSAPSAAGGPAEECLLSIPRWDFDWQRGYTYGVPVDQLPTVAPGDVLRVKCTYDNTMGNPKMGRALKESGLTSPQIVTLGESTLDEMCLASLVFVYEP
ncbi:MAG: hypothetical protein JST00_27185 [Deltaproteobacteria bacterium]|nr:hypothetical protein [Deltaproteobacteria bacterium]